MRLFGILDLFGGTEFLIIAVVAVLLFGERLPEVARKAGRHMTDFKRMLQGVREDFESATRGVTDTVERSVERRPSADREEATAPKFEPPPPEPNA
jgi:sec-independent protein translocase protein TatA